MPNRFVAGDTHERKINTGASYNDKIINNENN